MFFAIIKNAYLPVALFVNNEVVFNMFAIPAVKRSEEVLLQIKKGVMYHLRDGHPVIDGIGLLENEAGEYWLVYIQISIRQYGQHRPNLAVMLSTKKGETGYNEIASPDGPDSIFEYYKQMINGTSSSVAGYIYLYISTKTVYDINIDNSSSFFKNMNEHSENNCYVGVLSTESELYKQFVNANLRHYH